MQILAVRIGRVGDTVMMTSALKAILECYPDAEITLLASPEGKRLLDDYHPRIKSIWVWNRYNLGAYFNKLKILKKLKTTHFDKIFCFDSSESIAGLFKDTKAEFYWAQSKPPGKVIHSARHYLDTVAKACSKRIDDISVNLPVDPTASSALEKELVQMGIQHNDTVIMLHPTFSGYSKTGLRKREARKRKLWPAKNYADLSKRLLTELGSNNQPPKIIMALLPDEIALGEKIVSLSDNSIILIKSNAGFDRYKAILSRANLLVSPDTGPMHIASALGTRIIAMFSNKDPGDCGPYMDPDLFSVLRSEHTTQPELGISSITVDAVYEACQDQLIKIRNKPQHEQP